MNEWTTPISLVIVLISVVGSIVLTMYYRRKTKKIIEQVVDKSKKNWREEIKIAEEKGHVEAGKFKDPDDWADHIHKLYSKL